MLRVATLLALVAAGAPVAAAGAPAAAASTRGKAKDAPALADFGRGYRAYRAADYPAAVKALGAAAGKGLRANDWVLFLLGESEFYVGSYRAARGHFEQATRGPGRPADMAPARVADCLWMEGERQKAAAAYTRVIKISQKRSTAFVDLGVARFRVAQVTAVRNQAAAQKQFLALAKELPAHPLSDEALRLAMPPAVRPPPPPLPIVKGPPTTRPAVATGTPPAPPPPVATTPDAGAPPPAPGLAPADRLRRAETLTKDRHWDEALVELAKLPAELPPDLATERDFQIGMTKFHMRRDYARAAELLLGVVPRLQGERAAEAAFHGARALSRVDRDDEAIAGYKKVIDQYPRSRWAAEAQYLSGWLEYNRGRFRESLPGLHATLDHYGNSPFADDAAWCVAFAHFLLGEADAAFAGLARYAKMPATGMTADERAAQVAYWRARLYEKTGHKDEATAGYRELVRTRPLSYYGLLAGARLGDLPVELAPRPTTEERPPAKIERDPVVARVQELLDAGLNVEAGAELQRAEKDVLKRAGGDKAVPWLLGLYRRAESYHRAYALAEARGAGALAAAPTGGARTFWEAAYPRAYAPLVEKYGPPAGNPDVLLYAIMRKESGFNPLDVSYADARGLLQMIPPTSARVAAQAKLSFAPDELYEPETNVRLGALYIGSLFEKFGGQIPLTAGAYNAGPRAMTKWCEQHPRHPTDEFVELIAFAQTREYAKRVTALYARYRYLYGPTPYKVPLALETKVGAKGPDF